MTAVTRAETRLQIAETPQVLFSIRSGNTAML
jgi:hypothetical protein